MGEPWVREVSIKGNIPYLGRILLYDEFEDIFRWTGSGNAGDYIVRKDTTYSYVHNYSLYIATRATGAAADDWAKATRHSYITKAQTVSGKCHWLTPDITKVKLLEFLWTVYSGTIKYQAGIQYIVSTGKANYLASDGTWKDTGAPGQNLASGAWHRLVVSVDYRNLEYISLESDGFQGSLAGTSIYYTADTSRVELTTDLKIVASGAARAELYIDTMLIEAV